MAKVLTLSLFLIYLINSISADVNNNRNNAVFTTYYIQQLDSPSIVNLRTKRQANTDLSVQYKSVTNQTNPTVTTEVPNLLHSPSPPISNLTDKTVVVQIPDKNDLQKLLGVNGTGQLKDIINPVNTPVVSDPIYENPPKKGTTIKKAQTILKDKDDTPSPTTLSDDIIDNIDIPGDDVVKSLTDQNYTLNYTEEHHVYYNSTIFMDKRMVEGYWETFSNISSNNMLSNSHRRAMTVELKFDFPFYGSPVRNITVATGGFLYTGEYVHSWLAATQYIAPLMANFDSGISNSSFVRYTDNGTSFTVVWENVHLQDRRDVGTFSFSTTLFKNGDIMFTYLTVPMQIEAIQDDKHPVKVGLSDAYIIDKVIFFARRKTIYEYHRVNFAGTEIRNNTIIYLKALPTCLSYTTCQSCLNHDTTFDCSWCPSLNKCSIGTDRKRQDWLLKGCDRTQIKQFASCPAIGAKGNDSGPSKTDFPDQTATNSNENNSNSMSADRSSRKDTSAENNAEMKTSVVDNYAAPSNQPDSKSSVGWIIGLIPVCFIMTILVWVLYAYKNPHTKSGQLLIQYRPTHWSWRRGEARYTAATIHM